MWNTFLTYCFLSTSINDLFQNRMRQLSALDP